MKHTSARIGDIDMHYAEAGSGPPFVMVHGLGGSFDDWEHQVAEFSRDHRVIAPDLRGFGRSHRGGRAMTVPQMAEDLWGLLQYLGIARFTLMGHSMGGAVSLQLALDRPDAVSRMIIANSVPTFQPRSPAQRFEVAYRLAVMSILGPARLARIGAQRMYPGPEMAALREKSIARGARNTRSAYLGALRNLTQWSVVHRLQELKMPVLVLGAEHDYFTHEDTVQFAYALPRRRLHIFPGTHHGLPQEAPREFNGVVRKFLRQFPQ